MLNFDLFAFVHSIKFLALTLAVSHLYSRCILHPESAARQSNVHQ
jgi:hypothetical protein